MHKTIYCYSIIIVANQFFSFFFMISFIIFLTIIIYLLTDDLHNRDVK